MPMNDREYESMLIEINEDRERIITLLRKCSFYTGSEGDMKIIEYRIRHPEDPDGFPPNM